MPTHTIVVGAGIAGLWLANQLAAHGERVTVLEAYGKPGGRVLTSRHGYELGAGRVHRSHHRVRALLRTYRLHERPLSPAISWRPLGAARAEPNRFDAIWTALCAQLSRLPPRTLATHTLRDLAESTLGTDAARALLEQYPYRAETERLRADLALQVFRGELGTNDGFTVVEEGLSAMIEGLVRDFRAAGGTLLLNTRVTNVVRGRTAGTLRVELERAAPLLADRVILATHATALRALSVTRNMEALRHLAMAPLTRIYAEIPGGWRHPRTVTDSSLRYIIPINPASGLVMISYTDDRDTRRWAGLRDDALVDAIHEELRRLYGPAVPRPRWARAAEWTEGTTVWLPGQYSPARLSRAALQPRPTDMPGLYCCGESFSLTHQAWMEGALENAEMLWRLIRKT